MKTIILYVVMSMSSVDNNIEEHDFQPLAWTANTTQEYDKAWEECKLMENAYRQLGSCKRNGLLGGLRWIIY